MCGDSLVIPCGKVEPLTLLTPSLLILKASPDWKSAVLFRCNFFHFRCFSMRNLLSVCVCRRGPGKQQWQRPGSRCVPVLVYLWALRANPFLRSSFRSSLLSRKPCSGRVAWQQPSFVQNVLIWGISCLITPRLTGSSPCLWLSQSLFPSFVFLTLMSLTLS